MNLYESVIYAPEFEETDDDVWDIIVAVNSMVNVNDITGTEMKLAEIARAVDKRITPDGWGFVNENLVKLSNKVEELRA